MEELKFLNEGLMKILRLYPPHDRVLAEVEEFLYDAGWSDDS